jgi:hypothetical protein
LMFANIVVESSKLAIFDGWPDETRKASDNTFRCNYEFTERQTILFGSGSRSTTFVDAPDNQTSSGEWSRNAKVREMMDTAWFEWIQSKRTSPPNKFASGSAPNWWMEWIREHNDWWRELVLS